MNQENLHRRYSRTAGLLAALTVVAVGALVAAPLVGAAEVVVAVVRDGAGPDDRLVELIEEELVNHLPYGTTVRFKVDDAFDAGWRYDRAWEALENAFADESVDHVLAVGSLVTHAAARSEERLPKPVVSTFVQRADVFKLPYSDDGESLKENLNFVVIPQRAGADVRSFREMVNFDTLHVAVSAEDLRELEELGAALEAYEKQLGIQLTVVPVGADPSQAMAQMNGAKAVYLTRLQRLTTDKRRELIDELNRQGVPTFSMLGHPDVELGALAAVTPDIESQLVRRVAINLGRLLRGTSAAELPVLLSVDTRLRVNARTAKAIGYSPGREIRVFAEFVHPEELESEAEPLDFMQLFKMAEEGSRSLQVVDAQVEGFRQDQFRAKSGLLPQLSADVSYEHADTDLTTSEAGTFGSIVLRQSLFDDEIWSAFKSSKEIYQGSELDRESQRLDVLADAGQAFYALARTQAEYRIVAGDLRLTEDNLELARLRRDVGYSGREEVLRWESVLAQRRASLFRSAQTVESTRIALNQLLALDQGLRWNPDPPEIDPDVFPVFGGQLDPVFDDLARVEQVRSVLVDISLDNAPELGAIDRTIEAQEIQVGQLRRRYYVPKVFAGASFSEQLTSPDGPLFPADHNFAVSVSAAYPLFQGGRRKAELGLARSEQLALERQERLVVDLIERRTRTALQRCENSFPRIKFGLQGAEAAGENLELVRDQYAEGTVNVTDLLDAQNQKLTADQFVNSATYEFMGDLVELQRALAWFELDNTPEDRDAFVALVLSAISEEQP